MKKSGSMISEYDELRRNMNDNSNLNSIINDLVHLIASEVVARMQSNGQQTRIGPQIIQDKRFVGDKALGAYLGCTVQTINRLKRTGALPFHRYGRRYYYIKSEIDAAFKSSWHNTRTT